MEIAILALGCFWGPEIKFSKIKGVEKTEVGYCGGDTKNTNYKEVCTGKTNHAEVVKIYFNKEKINYKQLIKFFFEIHNPTTVNRQGPDIGSQYRSEIFYMNLNQKRIAEEIINDLNKEFNNKIVTKVSKVKNYTRAEEYHQKYLENRT
tara:strand:+ start:259 stop:705 length:447 start_codon:yes stop_codon:yes gene_type:complete